MSKKKIVVTILLVLATFLIVFTWFFSSIITPINRKGSISVNQTSTAIENSIKKQVGRGEVEPFSDLVSIFQYPGVSDYKLVRDYNFDHNWRIINFQTNDSIEQVLNYYIEKSSYGNNLEKLLETNTAGTKMGQLRVSAGRIDVSSLKPYSTTTVTITADGTTNNYSK